ncbi:MAG TPA: hypothetical protein VGS97_25075 [Actinocrinis sp.]|uniref:hypothetical protein n=1 Tax=Actinocrinis sp. TaxID=1920516 RepID=UPI002DDD8B18|nr:hypothetical protein [Actinocrinis sp.]HEV2347392.1 hypothetical protein [Actinocrinis sp.]
MAVATLRKIAQPPARKAAANTYRYAWERGPAYSDDPAVRERAWQAENAGPVTKSASVGDRSQTVAALLEVARTDPDPGQREAAWAALDELTKAR